MEDVISHAKEAVASATTHTPIPLPESSIFLHPAVVILLTVLSSQLLKLIGNAGILAVLSPIHLQLFHRPTLTHQRRLKKELFETRQVLNQTSSQDQFAKWAKLRRKVDKTLADLEAVNNTLASSKSSLGLLIKATMFTLSTLVPFVVTTWFRKTPIFWLPPGPQQAGQSRGLLAAVGPAGAWLGPLGWVVSLPSAPRGSVSATVWSQVCSRVLALVFSVVADIAVTFKLLQQGHSGQSQQTLAQPNPSLQAIWYSIGLATCSFAFSQFDYLEEVAGIDLSIQFGGHYQFLTNCGLALTFATLLLSLSTTLAPTIPYVSQIKTLASIIVLPVETMISLLYWTVLSIDPSLLVPSKRVADPLNPGQFVMEVVRLPIVTDICMHAFPAGLLLVVSVRAYCPSLGITTDISSFTQDYFIFSPPFPTKRTSILGMPFPHLLSLVSTLSYCVWAEICNYHNGHYPYPLLSVLSNVQRTGLYLLCAFLIVSVVEVAQRTHRFLDRRLNRTWIAPHPSSRIAEKKGDNKVAAPAATVAADSSSTSALAGKVGTPKTTSKRASTTLGDKEEL